MRIFGQAHSIMSVAIDLAPLEEELFVTSKLLHGGAAL